MSVLTGGAESDLMKAFSYKVRCRVCGILQSSEGLLMIKHGGLGPLGYLWAPPGGGIDFGLSPEQALKNEFAEETGLDIEVGQFLFVNEYRDEKYHAIELFFEVQEIAGELTLGTDPELSAKSQILWDIKRLSDEEIDQIPSAGKHNIFQECGIPSDIGALRGFFKFANN